MQKYCMIFTVLNHLIKAFLKQSKGAEIRNRYNQVLHLTQDTNGKVTNSHSHTLRLVIISFCIVLAHQFIE